jgi:hypothetical protein
MRPKDFCQEAGLISTGVPKSELPASFKRMSSILLL